jgi:hypothetical protein
MSDKKVSKFTVSRKTGKFMSGIVIASLIIAVTSGIISWQVSIYKPPTEEFTRSLDDRETYYKNITVEKGQSLYYIVDADEHLDVRFMTYEDYQDKINGRVYSYIKNSYTDGEEEIIGPLEAGVYVILLEGDTNTVSVTYKYAIYSDNTGSSNVWLGVAAVTPLCGLLLYLVIAMIGDTRHNKRK